MIGTSLLGNYVSLLYMSCATNTPEGLSVKAYGTIQEAIHQNPGQVLYVPSGDYEISQKVHIASDGSGLSGPGRIIQTNAEQPILDIEKGKHIRIEGLTLIRTDGCMETTESAIKGTGCEGLDLQNLRILNNLTRDACIALRNCHIHRSVIVIFTITCASALMTALEATTGDMRLTV